MKADTQFWRDLKANRQKMTKQQYRTIKGQAVKGNIDAARKGMLLSLIHILVRLENLYIDFLGANNTGYVKAATRKSFVAAVARIYEPGTKFDSVVVLVGPQGCGKSTIFAKMGNEYYSDSLNLTDMKDKSGAEKLQGRCV